METESSLRNIVLQMKTGRSTMPKNTIIVLMNHRNKLLDPLLNLLRSQPEGSQVASMGRVQPVEVWRAS
jgi:hypothetical protein